MQFESSQQPNKPKRTTQFLRVVAIAVSIITMNYVHAGKADVLNATIKHLGGDRYRINTTVKHEDAGWDHYADRWDVLDTDGNVLDSRVLAHPHDNEQPFTRSLTLSIPAGMTTVIIRANDSVHGLGGVEFELAVPDNAK